MRPREILYSNQISLILRNYLSKSKRLIIFVFLICMVLYFLKKLNSDEYKPNSNRNRNSNAKIKFKNEKLNQALRLNSNLTDKFWDIIEKDCDPSILKVDRTCLETINEFNKKIDYSFENKDNCNECYWLKLNENEKIYHHVFWKLSSHDPNSFNSRIMHLNIMSYLATQNLCCTKLIFWKLPDFPNEIVQDLTKKFQSYIDIGSFEIKTFDLRELCSNKLSSFQDKEWCKSSDLSQHYAVDLSDFIRFFVLDSYGGIYTDGDVMYLKDMRIFWGTNMAYRWSFTENFNTAIIGINNKNDPYLNAFINYLKDTYNDVGSFIKAVHPYSMTNIVKNNLKEDDIFKNKIFKMLHTGILDPSWLCYDGITPRFGDKYVCNFDEFSDKEFVSKSEFKPEDFFPGAFTYHIHLRNANSNIKKNSYLKLFENYYHSKLILD